MGRASILSWFYASGIRRAGLQGLAGYLAWSVILGWPGLGCVRVAALRCFLGVGMCLLFRVGWPALSQAGQCTDFDLGCSGLQSYFGLLGWTGFCSGLDF